MDGTIAGILLLDGLASGAVYALLGMAIVLVFAVTRVIFIPQGEFVAISALTLAMLQTGRLPGTVWLAVGLAALGAARLAWDARREGRSLAGSLRLAAHLCGPALLSAAAVALLARHGMPPGAGAGLLALQALATLALVTSLGPLVHRLVYHPVADGSVLLLLIISVGVHFALVGIALILFGAEGYRTPPFWDARFDLAGLGLTGQTLVTLATSVAGLTALWLFFGHTLAGKALRATAVNRLGARLMGISTEHAGRHAFTMAAFIGALSGLLIGPTTTIVYDSGFLIGLKGFIAAIFGGLASYPLTGAGALFVGLLDSFSSFWASAWKEVIVFTAILPVLLMRSLADPAHDEDA